jgi:protein-S-isoprenylcysteine O-methyltransferase Ste14
MSNAFALKVFKYRSYTPLPFLALMVIFAKPTAAFYGIGLAVAVAGEAIRLWGVSWAGSETRTTGAVGGSNLVISGPFAFVRNPLYVGNILLYVGIGIMSKALFPYLQVVALLFFLWQYYTIVIEEEGYLRKTFAAQYEAYYKNVPRFIPRLTPYRNPAIPQPTFEIDAGISSETRTLQAFASVIALITLLWFLR